MRASGWLKSVALGAFSIGAGATLEAGTSNGAEFSLCGLQQSLLL
jgi:hypothetical protein